MPYDVSPPSSTDDLTASNAESSEDTARQACHSVHSWRDGTRDGLATHDDVSSQSDASDQDVDYATDQTSPTSSGHESSDCADEGEVDDFRDREYPQLRDKVYLDTGGSMLYAKSLIEAFSADLTTNLYGNPHSASTPAALAGARIDAIREKALRFFRADPDEWDLVFTANATAAIKLVIECLRDYGATSNTPVWYGYHKDAHTSLVGIRELVKMHRCFANDDEVDNWIKSGGIGGARARQIGLFAYPGQSNMTGRRLPLSWCGQIRKSIIRSPTYTLLDAAALACTAPLDLSDVDTSPDFIALSFYKIFGFPNIGALLVRKQSAHVLQARRYFGGGTVDMIIAVNDSWHAMKSTSVHDRLEDGTLPFHSIFALDHAIDVHERLYGSDPMKFISHHTSKLALRLYQGLISLHHSNGSPLATIYKDSVAQYGDATTQGATIALNIRRSDGAIFGYEDVEKQANDQGIYVRSGSLCNPGGVASYLQWSPPEMRQAYASGHRCSNPTQVMLGKPTGVIRVSIGAMNNTRDIDTFLRFIASYVEHSAQAVGLSPVLEVNECNTTAQAGNRIDSGYMSLASPGFRPMSITPSIATTSTAPSWPGSDRDSLVQHTANSSVSLSQPIPGQYPDAQGVNNSSTTNLSLFPSPPPRPDAPSRTTSNSSVPTFTRNSSEPLLSRSTSVPNLPPQQPQPLQAPPPLPTPTPTATAMADPTTPNPYVTQSHAHLLPSRTFRARHRTHYHQQMVQQQQEALLYRQNVQRASETLQSQIGTTPESVSGVAAPQQQQQQQQAWNQQQSLEDTLGRTQRLPSVDERLSALPLAAIMSASPTKSTSNTKIGRLFGGGSGSSMSRNGMLRKERSLMLRT